MEDLIVDALDNTSKLITHEKNDYILLIKKKSDRNVCTLFLTDCGEYFWLERIDQDFVQYLKEELKINSEMNQFLKLLAKSIKKNFQIQFREKNKVTIKVPLRVGQGLILNCRINIDTVISLNKQPDEHYRLTKVFFRQLYEAKDQQVQSERKAYHLLQRSIDQMSQLPRQAQDPAYIKKVFSKNKNQQKHKNPRNRDLLNPNKKRRSRKGAKISKGNQLFDD